MSVSIDLSGRTALVTGSTSGIGFATAEALARAGARVVVNGRNEERVAAAIKALNDLTGSGEITGAVGDVGTAAGAEAIFAAVPDLDVLVNNAGIFEAVPFFDIPDEEWQRYFDVNVLSGIRLARHYARGMVERGWGRVIFVSSESAVQPPTEMVHYGMTKTAQLAVSRGLAQTVAGSGVTVNSVLPGPTLTDGVRDLIADRIGTDMPFEEAEARFMAEERPTSLLRRLIRPAEIGNFISYVASDLSSATTGAALRVDGGTASTIIP